MKADDVLVPSSRLAALPDLSGKPYFYLVFQPSDSPSADRYRLRKGWVEILWALGVSFHL
jgi:hypothetical protein